MDTDFKGCPLWRPAIGCLPQLGLEHPPGGSTLEGKHPFRTLEQLHQCLQVCIFIACVIPILATSIRGGCQAAGCGNAETSALPMPVLRSFQLVAILRLNSANELFGNISKSHVFCCLFSLMK